MIEYLQENLWLFWACIAAICLILELSSGDFFVTCFAIGALFGMVSTFAGLPFWAQVVVWVVFSVLSICFIRPKLTKWLHKNGEERRSNADALIGRVGTVIERIEPNGSGYIKVDGDEWKSVAADHGAIEVGEKVRIVSRESIVMTVERV